MKRRLKTIALVAAATLLLGALAAAAVRFIDVERYRPRFESAIHDATGLDCSLGHLSLSLWPFPNLRADHPTLGHAGRTILKAERLTLSVRLLPLLDRRLELRALTLTRASGTIRRDKEGRLNLLPTRKKERPAMAGPFSGLRIAEIVLDNADLRYEDAATGFFVAAREMDLALGPFTFVEKGKASGNPFAGAWQGHLAAKAIRTKNLTLDRPSVSFAAQNRSLTLQPVSATVHGGKLTAAVTVNDFPGPNPQWSSTCTIDGLDLASLSTALRHRNRLTGRLQVNTGLTTSGTGRAALLRRLNGNVAMHGQELTIDGIDLDTVLSHYAKSQELDLFDLGSIFLVGPFGPLLGKAFDLTGSALGVGRGKSRITRLASEWSVANGVAAAQDVALATPQHRLAARGRLDLAAERFRDFRVALVDRRGCATVTQTIGGTFRHPEVGKADFLTRAIVNPILSLFRKGAATLNGKPAGCATPFYQGSIPHPAGKP
ncbi:MAG: AsmA family protein [Thermodesulfobacteriota bacterium]